MPTIELTEEQRKALLQIINQANFRGDSIEFVLELKRAIQGGLSLKSALSEKTKPEGDRDDKKTQP